MSTTLLIWSNLALALVVAISNVLTYFVRLHDRNEGALDMFIQRFQTLLSTKIRNMEIRTIVKANDFYFNNNTKHLKVIMGSGKEKKSTGFHHEVITLLLAYEELAYYVKNGRIKFTDASYFFNYDMMLFWESEEIQKMIKFKRTKDGNFLKSFEYLCGRIKGDICIN
jgi:hypothetical protein